MPFNIYKLSDDQLNLFFSKPDGNLDLDKIFEKMEEFIAPVDEGVVSGEGFLNIQIRSRIGISLIEAFATGSGSLGYYNQAYMNGNDVTAQRRQYKFYSKSRIFITENNLLVIYFDDTTEEKIKSSVKGIVEALGFEVSNFQLSDPLMRKIRTSYTWNEVKLEKVDNEGDSTKKVYYEIDTADADNDSLIDKIYRDQGKMVQISFEMPYSEVEAGPNFLTVKLYRNDNRIVFFPNEFVDFEHVKDFVIFLTNKLMELSKEEPNNEDGGDGG